MIVMIASCKNDGRLVDQLVDKEPAYTENEKREYFENNIAYTYGNGFRQKDSTLKFSYFMRTHYPKLKAINITDPLIYALEEEYINSETIDTNRKWFRIVVSPCFAKPYCLVLEKKQGKTYFSTKMTNGDGGYYCGTLDFVIKKTYSDSVYDNLSIQLHNWDFWNLDLDTACYGGLDGESWTIEAIENGNYNIISRWLPQSCGNKTTRQIGGLGLDLRSKSKMVDILSIYNEFDHKFTD